MPVSADISWGRMVFVSVLATGITLVTADAGADGGFIPMEIMRKATLGSYKGAFTDCSSQRRLDLVLREMPGDGESLSVYGTLSIVDSPGSTSSTSAMNAAIAGAQLADSGYVTLRPQPPKSAQNRKDDTSPLALLSERFGGKKQAPATPVVQQFGMGFIRDFEGIGFTGVFASPNIECHSFVLTRTDGSTSGILPLPDVGFIYGQAALLTNFILEEAPFNGRMAYSPSRHESMPGVATVFYDQPWLLYAAKLGHPTAMASLGRIYEFALGVPLNYDEALRYYTLAADQNNASAQAGLARLYGSGFGVSRDIARSKQFSAQFNATRIAALKLCTAPAVMNVTTQMISAGMQEPPPLTPGNILAGASNSSRNIDLGTSFVYQGVSVVSLATTDKPFLCKYTVKLVDAKVTDMTRYRQWKVTNPDGRVYYYDNKDDIAAGQDNASLLTVLANAVPALEVFEVVSLGGSGYRISRMQDGMSGLRPAASIDIKVSAGL